jgi:hypothetical protein
MNRWNSDEKTLFELYSTQWPITPVPCHQCKQSNEYYIPGKIVEQDTPRNGREVGEAWPDLRQPVARCPTRETTRVVFDDYVGSLICERCSVMADILYSN